MRTGFGIRALFALAFGGFAGLPVMTAQEDAATEASEKVMLVIDSSGSMWGRIEGEIKRDIARRALRETIELLPEAAETGLIAYGHRRTRDCSDIELLLAPSASGLVSIPDMVDGLTPTGKTPLTASVRRAAEALNIGAQKSTVVVITDGIETCNADPCAAGTELEAAGVDFTAHVIGFGLSQSEGRQIACLAEVTGGLYIEASDASELSGALEQVAGVVDEPAPVIEAAEATINGPDSAEIGATFEVEWTGPQGDNDYVDLVPVGYEKTTGELSYAYVANGSPVAMRGPKAPGAHVLRYVWVNAAGRQVLAHTPIEITEAAVAIFAPSRVEAGETFSAEWRGPGLAGDYLDIVPSGYERTSGELAYAYTRQGDVLTIQAPGEAGAHDLRYVTVASDGKRVLVSVDLQVDPARAELAFDPEVSLGQEVEVHWAGPGSPVDYIDLVPRGYTRTNGELSYQYTNAGNPAVMTLPGEPGEYDIRYVLDASDGKKVLVTEPLTLNAVEVSLNAPDSGVAGAVIEVTWSGPGAATDYIDIVPDGHTRTNGESSYTYVREGSPLTIRLPGQAGDYELRYVLSASNGRQVLAKRDLNVTMPEIALQFEGVIAAGGQLSVDWTGPDYPSDYIDIVPRGFTRTNGELKYAYTAGGNPAVLDVPDEPGDYDLRYVMTASKGRHAVVVEPLTVE